VIDQAIHEAQASGAPISFPANSLLFTVTAGTISFNLLTISDTLSVAGLSMTNQSEEFGTLEEIDGVLRLYIPISISTSFSVPQFDIPISLTLAGQFVANYVLPGPIDPVDYFDVELQAGQILHLSTSTPLSDPSDLGQNGLDPALVVLAADGSLLAAAENSASDGRNALLSFTAPAAGTYRIGIRAESGQGEYVLHSSISNGPAPRVTSVSLRGTGPIPFIVPVGGGEQLRSVPLGGIQEIAIQFSEHVIVDQDDLTIVGNQPSYAFSNFNYNSATFIATWTLAAPLDADQLTLILNADGVDPIVDVTGNRLDGEWTNPASTDDPAGGVFPSGDGEPGGNFTFRLNILPGDINRNGSVTGADYTIWADNFGKWNGTATYQQGDLNGDGYVTGADYTIWADHFSPTAAPLNTPASTPSETTASSQLPSVAEPTVPKSNDVVTTSAPRKTVKELLQAAAAKQSAASNQLAPSLADSLRPHLAKLLFARAVDELMDRLGNAAPSRIGRGPLFTS
jgi:hypothetical protein